MGCVRLCAATGNSIKIWDLENKSVHDEIAAPMETNGGLPWCSTLLWSADGSTLPAFRTRRGAWRERGAAVRCRAGLDGAAAL